MEYPTRTVHLWLMNDEPMYRDVTGKVRDILDEAEGDEDASPVYEMEKWLKDYVTDIVIPEENTPEGLTLDLLTGVLGDVKWGELAHLYIGDELAEREQS